MEQVRGGGHRELREIVMMMFWRLQYSTSQSPPDLKNTVPNRLYIGSGDRISEL